jgi:hypothetical protein
MKAYGVKVWQNRHPGIRAYIAGLLRAAGREMKRVSRCISCLHPPFAALPIVLLRVPSGNLATDHLCRQVSNDQFSAGEIHF